MAIRVGTTETNPTHHIKLQDRDGTQVGLILCNDKGEPAPMYNKTPIDRTALKTSSGMSKYSDYNYPYSPIVQDDWSGGRANLDFERDSTRYFDAYTLNTRHPNRLFLGPKAYFSKGYRSQQYTVDGRYNYWGRTLGVTQFTANASFTSRYLWLRLKTERTTVLPATVTVELRDSAGTTTLASTTATLTENTISGEWVVCDLSYALVSGTTYTIYVDQTNARWQTTGNVNGSTDITDGEGAFFIEPAEVDDTVIYYEYRGQQYKVISPVGGTPTVWMNGDRGAADSNAGQLDKLIDATKTWTVNQWAGCIVRIIAGTGIAEPQLYRTVVSNTATELVCDSDWTIAHTTATEYVILGSDTWRELTGHGLTAKVTAVLSTPDQRGAIVYFAQGEAAYMRDHYEYNNAGVWSESNWRANGTNYAVHLAYQPLSNKVWRTYYPLTVPSVASATPVVYGTDLTFSAAISVGTPTSLINGVEVYPSDAGTEALWVHKEHLSYVVTTQAEGIKLDEMRHMRSRLNGAASVVHNVYQYFTLGNGLQRYYGGSIDSVGPNLDEGLPTDRQGAIVQLLGYPGRVMAIVNAGADGYSSLLERSGSGYHEVYRAPLGKQIKGMALQVIPGDTPDRLWLYVGNTSIWLNIASLGQNEWNDTNYRYATDGSIILSRMHAGMYDVQKIIRLIRLWSAGLQIYGSTDIVTPLRHEIAIDYRIDDETEWTLNTEATYGNTNTLTPSYGLAGKRIQLRVRVHSYDDHETPQIQAVIVEAVLRSQIKYMYNLTFRVMDDEPTLAIREADDNSITAAGKSAMTKLAQIEAWSDSDSDSLLYMTSNSPLYNGKYVFINPPTTRQIALDPDPTRQWTGTTFICTTIALEA